MGKPVLSHVTPEGRVSGLEKCMNTRLQNALLFSILREGGKKKRHQAGTGCPTTYSFYQAVKNKKIKSSAHYHIRRWKTRGKGAREKRGEELTGQTLSVLLGEETKKGKFLL